MQVKALVTLSLIAATLIGHLVVTRPALYRQCSSPTGDGLVLEVLRARTPPYIEGVAVIINVRTADGKEIYRNLLSNEDLWSDVDVAYPKVLCMPDRFVVGPGWWDGNKKIDFVLFKSQITSIVK